MSTPNHLMTHSGTSCGLDDNLNFNDCGGNTTTFPQATIYDSLAEDDVSFRLYSNSTIGELGLGCCALAHPLLVNPACIVNR